MLTDFELAFLKARASGQAVFTWQGKKYHTRTKAEEYRQKQESQHKLIKEAADLLKYRI